MADGRKMFFFFQLARGVGCDNELVADFQPKDIRFIRTMRSWIFAHETFKAYQTIYWRRRLNKISKVNQLLYYFCTTDLLRKQNKHKWTIVLHVHKLKIISVQHSWRQIFREWCWRARNHYLVKFGQAWIASWHGFQLCVGPNFISLKKKLPSTNNTNTDNMACSCLAQY